MTQEWEDYKKAVKRAQKLMQKNSQKLSTLYVQCTCEETTPKEFYTEGGYGYYSSTTKYDMCVVCGKQYNKTTKRGSTSG